MITHQKTTWIGAGIFLLAAIAVTTVASALCTPAAPCFDQNNDILSGQRDLLPVDDLYITNRDNVQVQFDPNETGRTVSWSLLTGNAPDPFTLDPITVFSSNSLTNCFPNPQVFAQSLIGRVFALPHDVVVTIKLNKGCTELLLEVIDKKRF